MAKYIVFLVALIVAGAAFVYSTQTANAPTAETTQGENPFGDGSQAVGTVESNDVGKDTSMSTDENQATAGAPSPTTDAEGGVPMTQPGVITRAELARHNTQPDCWIGYKGTVYDITNWLPKHPGSAGAIAPFCGTADEFAAAFNRQHGTGKDKRLEREGEKEGALGI